MAVPEAKRLLGGTEAAAAAAREESRPKASSKAKG
jgi:hypothetical protein